MQAADCIMMMTCNIVVKAGFVEIQVYKYHRCELIVEEHHHVQPHSHDVLSQSIQNGFISPYKCSIEI